jgi:far upstream element-binding protein
LAKGHALVTVQVPNADVGLIIGKGGATLNSIIGQMDAKIQIPVQGNVDNPEV